MFPLSSGTQGVKKVRQRTMLLLNKQGMRQKGHFA
jgi:hypothetical protein